MKYTPKKILKDAKENIKDVKKIIIVVEYDNGEITHSCSDMTHIEAIGLMEATKHDLLLEMTEENYCCDKLAKAIEKVQEKVSYVISDNGIFDRKQNIIDGKEI